MHDSSSLAPVSMEVRRVPGSSDVRAVPAGSTDLRPVPPSAELRFVKPPLPALMLEARELRRRMLVSAAAANTCARVPHVTADNTFA